MEVVPTILSDVIYDVEAQTFFCKEVPFYLIDRRAFSTDIPVVNPTDMQNITEPTYIMNTYHSCWGHAYEYTLGLLSVLHECDAERLRGRNYRLFVLRELWSDDYTLEQIAWNIKWDFKYVDYSAGKYNGPYTILHECISSAPILFERSVKHRYIHFDKILYGGNLNNQRIIHNCHERYPNRLITPVATDEQIRGWMANAKDYLKGYLQIKDKVVRPEKTVLFIDRKGSRAFTEQSKATLESLTKAKAVYMEDYSFAEQIQAFVDADIVIAVHGTSLVHLIWSAPGTRLIEIHGGISPVAKIFKSYTKFLSQDIRQIFTTDMPWDTTYNDSVNITEGNSEEIRKLLTSWASA